MVQKSQKPSLLTGTRSPSVEGLVIQMHEANSLDKLSRAIFELIDLVVPNQFLILIFRPLEFELPCKFSPLSYKQVVDDYMAHNHKEDLWLERSPVNPKVTVVRHGDFTPVEVLHSSNYYQNVLLPLGSEYGASVVAWRESTWLATLTIMRNQQQGEFTDAHMDELLTFHPHFASVIRRLASDLESRLAGSTLMRFVAKLPTATMVLSWDLKPVHFNPAASQFCQRWQKGRRAASVLKTDRQPRIPTDILRALEDLRAIVQAKASGPEQSKALHVEVIDKRDPLTKAEIQFIPSRTLSLTKGTFLITFSQGGQANTSIETKLNQLTPRERDCVLLVAAGMNNGEIAERLGKSQITVRNQLTSVYKKLGLNSRHKLITAFANQTMPKSEPI